MDRAHAPAQALLLAAFAWLPACGLNQAGVPPFNDTVAYPASAVMDRTGDWLFLTNSNADLRYNDGTLMAFSLTRAAVDRDPNGASYPSWQDCPQVDYQRPRIDPKRFCCWDRVDTNILDCDERGYVGPDGAEGDGSRNVRIGSFSAGMVLQRAKCPVDFTMDQSKGEVDCAGCASADFSQTDDRLLIGVRGDTSLTFVDVGQAQTKPDMPPELKCVTDPNAPNPPNFDLCDSDHRIIKADTQLAAPMKMAEEIQVPLPDEPYALAIDDANGLLYVGHLTGNTGRAYSGGFSLFDIAPRGSDAVTLDDPRFVAPFPSPFPATSLGSLGITAMNVRTDLTVGHLVFASSRYVPEVAGLTSTATCPDTNGPTREIAAFPNGTVFTSPLNGAAETRGIQFVDRHDPGVPDPGAYPCDTDHLGAVATCSCQNGSSGLTVCGGNQAYGDCVCSQGAFVLQRNPPALIRFVEGDQSPSDVLETCGSPTFLDQHDSGLGPRLFVTCFADGEIYVFDPAVPTLEKTIPAGRGPSGLVFDDKRQVAYVVGFGDNNIGVIDLRPGSPTEYHMIQRLGFQRTTPR